MKPTVAAIALAAGLWACRGEGRQPPPPGELIGGLYSYQTVQEAQRQIDPGLLPWTVIHENKHPEFSELSVVVNGYAHNGERGRLRLGFLNGRLAGARFYPIDYETYVSRLPIGNQLRAGVRLKQGAHIEVFAVKDSIGMCVAWHDVRLSEEAQRLVYKHT